MKNPEVAEQVRILIADDEESFLYATADLFREAGYECDCALDSAEVIEKLQEGDYGVLIADIKMPGNPDLELIQALPQLAPGMPVIIVTGYPTLRSAVQSIQLPVVAYLTKPLDFEELLAEVRNAIERFHLNQTLCTTRQRVQEWHQDLERIEQLMIMKPREGAAQPIDAFLALTLHHIADCVGDLERFKTTLAKLRAEPHPHQGGSSPGMTALHSAHTLEGTDASSDISARPLLQTLKELQTLSSREWEIVRRLCANQRVASIAGSFHLSPHTVRSHLKSIFRKVGVHSQAELLEFLERKCAEATGLPQGPDQC